MLGARSRFVGLARRLLRAAVVGQEEDRLAAGCLAVDGHDGEGWALWFDQIVDYESARKDAEFVATAEGTLHVAYPEVRSDGSAVSHAHAADPNRSV
jgi:hypothetical protein